MQQQKRYRAPAVSISEDSDSESPPPKKKLKSAVQVDPPKKVPLGISVTEVSELMALFYQDEQALLEAEIVQEKQKLDWNLAEIPRIQQLIQQTLKKIEFLSGTLVSVASLMQSYQSMGEADLVDQAQLLDEGSRRRIQQHQKDIAALKAQLRERDLAAREAKAQYTKLVQESKEILQGIQNWVDHLDPNHNRTYGPGATFWEGPLKDDFNRGPGFEYFCPDGWTRVGLTSHAKNFDALTNGWNVVYHGTSHTCLQKILRTSVRASKYGHVASRPVAYVSPAIEYCAHPTYARPYQLQSGQWCQIVLQCRINPTGVLGYEDATVLGQENQDTVIDSRYPNETMEWKIAAEANPQRGQIGNILVYGLMFRKTDEYPDQDSSNEWWQSCWGKFGDPNQDYGVSRGQAFEVDED